MTVPPNVVAIEIIRAMRPHQWIKNLFVLTPLVFGGQLTDLAQVILALCAMVLFSLVSGSVYLLNDVVDRERDRRHPLKRLRPVAAGRLPVNVAVGALVVGVAVATLGGWAVTPRLALAIAGYFMLHTAYSFILKHIVFVDLVAIAAGFILRILAGAVAVGVPLSPWLVLCTFLLAIFLGMGKRKHELIVSGENGTSLRSVLARYRLSHLNMALNITSAVTTLAYLLYTTSERTVAEFGTGHLLFTIPFIVFGLVRFMQILETHRESLSPTEYMLKDIPFLINLVLWALTVVLVIYVF